ncbi:MAG: UDP-glucose 4-epimerase GalE [Salinivirgaceae bacterium]|nr:UDP-glucose 4-epimerase GalE [Salinivirgaceae bacterium]MDD4746562.1 UDP-glucose 4-epimerase GalE [Salinivirgaceae bacterium]MDY0279614.1 UDP-glucose 4-epimerase GalE [Salinivirgaceae bacterium]
MEKILITGGAGFIGSHTAALMISQGYEIIIVDNYSNSNKNVLTQLKKITGKTPQAVELDITDYNALQLFWEKNSDIDSVIHFAAHKAVGESVEQPIKYYQNNLKGLLNILEIGLKYNLKNFVFSSSCTVYGQPETLPVTEESPYAKAESPYGNTKKICEDILHDLNRSNAPIRIVALRYFNPIGAHPTGLIGELPIGVPNNLIPFITQTAAGIRKQLSIFGNDYNTPDGTCIRDYIDVNDLGEAHLAALKYLQKCNGDSHMAIFNIGTGKGLSVKELVDAFEESTGVNVPYKYADRRPGDIEQIWAETSLANKTLHWKAKTPIKETLLNAWKWEKYYREVILTAQSSN